MNVRSLRRYGSDPAVVLLFGTFRFIYLALKTEIMELIAMKGLSNTICKHAWHKNIKLGLCVIRKWLFPGTAFKLLPLFLFQLLRFFKVIKGKSNIILVFQRGKCWNQDFKMFN